MLEVYEQEDAAVHIVSRNTLDTIRSCVIDVSVTNGDDVIG